MRELYAKEGERYASSMFMAFLTRKLFVMRWGEELGDAITNHPESAEDFWNLKHAVEHGYAVRVDISIVVRDSNGTPLASFDDEQALLAEQEWRPQDAGELTEQLSEQWREFMGGTTLKLIERK